MINKLPAYRHVFFDLDHTLWDFDRNARISLEELHTEFELESGPGIAFEPFYEKYLHHNEILWKRYHNGFISSEELKWKRMWRTLLEYGIANEELSRKMSERFLEILPTKKEVFPFAFEILDYLSEKNYVLHIITNGFEKTQYSKLDHSGLKKYFRHVITSEKSNSMKPQKEIFEFAVNLAETNMKESIMIGDNPEADIAGAISAGMDSVFVNYNDRQTDLKPTYTISQLSQLKEIL